VALWNHFNTAFGRMDAVMSNKDAFEGYMQHMVTQMLNNSVQNIEIKIQPERLFYDFSGNVYDFNYVVKFLRELVNKTRAIEPSFSIKIILVDFRWSNYTTLLPLLTMSLEYRNKYPDMVVGFDLAGAEDEGNTLLYFLNDFLTIANLSKSYQYDMPYYFHAGETLMANNTNLFDAILLSCFRIGHAFQLVKHPILTQMVKENGIGLEICPVSNQILGYAADLRGHHALSYFNKGLMMTISPDDPAIYGYGGVSYDWYEILLGWSLDIPGLKQLAMNSYIKGSFFDKQEQAVSMQGWMVKWNAWINWVVKTYSK